MAKKKNKQETQEIKDNNITGKESTESQNTKDSKDRSSWLERWQVLAAFLMLYDIAAIHVAYLFALWGRFDFIFSQIPELYLEPYKKFITAYSFGCVIIFWLFRMYKSMWRYAGYDEFIRIVEASGFTSVLHMLLITVIIRRMPLTYYFFGALLQMILLLIGRFGYKIILYTAAYHRKGDAMTGRVMLIGAGEAGQAILRELANARETNDKVVCIIDDNPYKWNRYFEGVPIVGGRDDILTNVEKYKIDKIFMAIPSATAEEKRDILNICSETNCEL